MVQNQLTKTSIRNRIMVDLLKVIIKTSKEMIKSLLHFHHLVKMITNRLKISIVSSNLIEQPTMTTVQMVTGIKTVSHHKIEMIIIKLLHSTIIKNKINNILQMQRKTSLVHLKIIIVNKQETQKIIRMPHKRTKSKTIIHRDRMRIDRRTAKSLFQIYLR